MSPTSPRDADGRKLFTSKVAAYVASRPDYPAALLNDLAPYAGGAIADFGAGTGIFTRMLVERGRRVTAVEPNDAMRAAADAALGHYTLYRSVAGSAENSTLAQRSIDLITAAQAFHWFDIERTRAECLRILKPHGRVALIWNDRLLSDPLQQALDEIFERFGGARRAALLTQEDSAHVRRFFGERAVEQWSYPHEHRLDRQAFIALALSRSYMPQRNSAPGRQATDAVSRLFESFAAEGRVIVRYRTSATLGRPA